MLFDAVLSHDTMSNHVARASKPQIIHIDSIKKTCEEGCEEKSKS